MKVIVDVKRRKLTEWSEELAWAEESARIDKREGIEEIETDFNSIKDRALIKALFICKDSQMRTRHEFFSVVTISFDVYKSVVKKTISTVTIPDDIIMSGFKEALDALYKTGDFRKISEKA